MPGYIVMFTLINLLMYGGISLTVERTSGVLRRIAVHPIAKWQLVVGKILGRFLLGLVQSPTSCLPVGSCSESTIPAESCWSP